MKAVLLRTGSVPVLASLVPGSPRVSLSRHDSFTGALSGEKTELVSPRISLHLDVNRRGITRALSEPDLIRSESDLSRSLVRGIGSQSFPAMIPEEECLSETEEVTVRGIGSFMLSESIFDQRSFTGDWTRSGTVTEELGHSGGGMDQGKLYGGGHGGNNNDFGTGNFAGGNADRSKIGLYFQEMLKSDPTNSLLLRNYAKYLHEVERNAVKAEEYYGRAILASPGDGEVLSLYGKLIWEADRDEVRAKSYFDQAVSASPDDCMVLGMYAQFMWEADEDDDAEEEEMEREVQVSLTARAAMVKAF